MSKQLVVSVIGCAVMLVVGTACSSSSATGASDVATPGNSNTGTAATGSTIKVMSILDEDQALGVRFDDTRAGLTAGVWAVNNRLGGLNGHKIVDVICDTNSDPNQVAACARQAVGDPSVVAIVGCYGQSAGIYPILESAGIPIISSTYNSVLDGTSSVSFPTANGDPAPPTPQPPGTDFMRDVVGAKKVAIAIVDVVGAAQSAAFLSKQIQADGMKVVATVPVPAESPDLSAQVAALGQSGADTVDVVTDSATGLRVLAEAAKQGIGTKMKFVINGGTLVTPQVLRQLGPTANSLYIQRNYAPIEYSTAPGVEQLKKDLQSAGLPVAADDQTEQAYVGFLLLEKVASKLKGQAITRSSVLATLKTISNWNADGLSATLDFTKPGPDPKFPRYVAPLGAAFPTKVVDGNMVAAPVGKSS